MEASVLDLRYKMKAVLEALERREEVRILYHGKIKGTIVPASRKGTARIADHPFFGMKKGDQADVLGIMDDLRKGRFNAL